jgi:Rieske Fe-S protein
VTDFTLSRRGVLGGTAVAVVGGIAGFLVAGRSSAARGPGGTTAANAYGPPARATGGGALVPLARVPAGGGVVLGRQKIVVTRTSDGAVHAFSAVCTHEGCTIDVARGMIECPCHGSRRASASRSGTGRCSAREVPYMRQRLVRSAPTVLWLLAAGFAVGVLIALR